MNLDNFLRMRAIFANLGNFYELGRILAIFCELGRILAILANCFCFFNLGKFCEFWQILQTGQFEWSPSCLHVV